MTNRKDWAVSQSCSPEIFAGKGLEELAAHDIHYMELTSGMRKGYEDVDFLRRSAEYCRQAKDAGVTIRSIHLPFAPFSALDPACRDAALREECIRQQTELMAAAADGGIGIAVIHPSGEPYQEEERAERIAIAIDGIGRLTDHAEKYGMKLALENLPRTCLCRTHDEMEQFLRAIPKLNVCYDTNHCLLESNVDYLRAVGSRVIALHISDYDFVDERHWYPGVGKNPWDEILSALEAVDYNGTFNYEIRGVHPQKTAENYRWLMNR